MKHTIKHDASGGAPVTEFWICDTCGEKILSPKDGWVEWLVRRDGNGWKMHGLRLVHSWEGSQRRGGHACIYDQQKLGQDHPNDSGLEDFLGPGGLMTLLSMLADERHPKEEVLEMIKRLHVAGYERARFHFDAAMAEGVFEPNTPPGFYTQDDIARVLRWLDESED